MKNLIVKRSSLVYRVQHSFLFCNQFSQVFYVNSINEERPQKYSQTALKQFLTSFLRLHENAWFYDKTKHEIGIKLHEILDKCTYSLTSILSVAFSPSKSKCVVGALVRLQHNPGKISVHKSRIPYVSSEWRCSKIVKKIPHLDSHVYVEFKTQLSEFANAINHTGERIFKEIRKHRYISN